MYVSIFEKDEIFFFSVCSIISLNNKIIKIDMSSSSKATKVNVSTKSSYVVELFRWNPIENVYEKKDDCTMTLDLVTGDFKVVSATPGTEKSEQTFININVITDNFSIISRERQNVASMHNLSRSTPGISETKDLTIDYEMRFETHRFGIRFDSRSSASETNFFNEFTKLRTRCKFTERYRSGNIKIEGTKTPSGYNGFCIEYYDKEGSPIKYMGEYEDGIYDGEGEFFSEDGNIRISCKNICSGKPNGIGRLVVGRNRVTKNIDMKEYADIKSTDLKYTNTIYARIEPMYDELMELLNFETLTIENRTMYLFRELQKLRNSLKTDPQAQKSFFNLF